MMKYIRKNPMSLEGRIEKCWLFTYRTPEESVRDRIPEQFELVTRDGYAFWNIVVCQVGGMRPKGFPEWCGVGYSHVAYRLHVRFRDETGAVTEGLYFLRSDCDQPSLARAGSVLTDFGFHTADIQICPEDDEHAVQLGVHSSSGGGASARLDLRRRPELGWKSPFATIEEANRFLKYKPFGISATDDGGANIVAITRDESAWVSRLVRVQYAHWEYLVGEDIEPEICYEVEPIDYIWNRGVVRPAPQEAPCEATRRVCVLSPESTAVHRESS